MAGQIKGITIEFDGDTTKLNKAITSIKSETKDLNTDLRQVNNALKFNPNNVELLAQKQKLLQERVKATKNQLTEFKNAQKQLDSQGVDKSSREYQKLRREIITTESKLKNFTKESRKLGSVKLTALGNQVQKVGAGMRTAGIGMSAAAGAGIIAGEKLLELTSVQSQAEDKLVEIYQKRMGATEGAAKSTMKLASAIQEQGVIGDEVTLSGAQQLATFAKMPETVNKLLPAMDNLLVQQKGYNATAQDATGIANLMGKAMMGQTGALRRVGISFDKNQEKVLKNGTEEQKAAMLAEVVTQNVGEMNKKFAETPEGKIQQAKNTLGDLGEQLGATLLPALASIAQWISANILPKLQELINFMQAHPMIAKIIVGITAFMAVAGPLLTMIGQITIGIAVLLPLIGGITAPMLGVVAVAAAVVAIGIGVIKNWSRMKAEAISLAKQVTASWSSFKAGVAKIWSGITSAVSGAVNRIKAVFNGLRTVVGKVASTFNAVKNAITHPIQTAQKLVSAAISKLKSLFSGLHFNLPHIKVPHFNISGGKAPWGLGGKGTKPSISVDYYAKGGIFTRPTLLDGNKVVGEAGAEAVLPLDSLWEHLNGMADSIVSGVAVAVQANAGSSGGGTIQIPIYLYPSGPKMGEQIVNMYDTYKKRMG